MKYDYQSNSNQPPSGKCYQSSSSPSQVSFSYTDADGGDNTVMLQAMKAGDLISCNTVLWTVTAVTPKGSNIVFTVDPAIAAPPYGVTEFGFGADVLPPGVLEAVIGPGQSVSNDINLANLAVVLVIAPDDWTPANITFQVSVNGSLWSDLFDASGTQVIKPIPPGSAILVDPEITRHVSFLRIRSGTRENPIAQTDDRIVLLATAPA